MRVCGLALFYQRCQVWGPFLSDSLPFSFLASLFLALVQSGRLTVFGTVLAITVYRAVQLFAGVPRQCAARSVSFRFWLVLLAAAETRDDFRYIAQNCSVPLL